ncbi:hypothetical protein HELRODRAFT_66822 [Helobdella robusta]|uniref:RecA family profile 1 domain-containing protein n=1 Tax=Helobdella robusta TaxID=6412 RepID=T1FYR5_HELRO|nr:hypothetical protein HELRODRAFT_66822 [Helobdella robusta]ESN99048.1 hypothetical protein HELRODRAFT_66822 [Helobdella robusta]
MLVNVCLNYYYRLLEIASARYGNVYVNEQSLLDMVSKVYVFRERSLQSLVNRLLDSLEDFVVMHNVGLIILDSIASLIRREFNASIRSNIFERNKVLTRQATQLKHLASSFHIPVIITNQITTQFKKPSDVNILHKDNCKVDEDNKCYALDDTTKNESTVLALGTYWTHCVNSRILLQYTEMHTLRELCLVKSSQAPPLKLFYTIDSSGLNIEGYTVLSSYYS